MYHLSIYNSEKDRKIWTEICKYSYTMGRIHTLSFSKNHAKMTCSMKKHPSPVRKERFYHSGDLQHLTFFSFYFFFFLEQNSSLKGAEYIFETEEGQACCKVVTIDIHLDIETVLVMTALIVGQKHFCQEILLYFYKVSTTAFMVL